MTGAASARYLRRMPLHRLPHHFCDVLVLGSGVAGLRAALAAAAGGAEVIVVAKADLAETNTRYAQGGIATVTDAEDSLESHAADTLDAARGLADEHIVQMVVSDAGDRIDEMIEWGARFDRVGADLALTREGGHTYARIIHAGGDATGAEIQRVLQERALGTDHIRVLRRTFAIDLLERSDGGVCGALAVGPDGQPEVLRAASVVLATGGSGAIFRETTNPPIATGDGIAMGYRAGAIVQDLEFMQFHPTVLYIAGAARTLVSEAVRGEGAHLLDKAGVRFMPDLHPQAELAPRDVVSRAIVRRIAETGGSSVFLDCRHLDPARVASRFPSIAEAVARFGLDLSSDLIPVHPAAHYTIGGLATDERGYTGVPGLYAAGEVASTGLHGANRLGSNSLLEAMVFGRLAGSGAAMSAVSARAVTSTGAEIVSPGRETRRGAEGIDLRDLENSLTFLLWRHAGVERDGLVLEEGLAALSRWQGYAQDVAFDEVAGWELQNQLLLGRLLLRGAIAREESRGSHYRRDHPDSEPIPRHSRQVRDVDSCRLGPREGTAEDDSVETEHGNRHEDRRGE